MMFETHPDRRTACAMERAHAARGAVLRDAWGWLFGRR